MNLVDRLTLTQKINHEPIPNGWPFSPHAYREYLALLNGV